MGPRPPRADRGGRAPGSAGPREERNNRRNDDRPREFGYVFYYMFLASVKLIICTPSIAHCLYLYDIFLSVNFLIFISDP